MNIDFKGRNVTVTDELRLHVERRLEKVSKQVSELARLEIEIFEEPNPRVGARQVAEGTLYLKGVTLRAKDSSHEMLHSLNMVVDELARQVKRHRDKLRHRRDARGHAHGSTDGSADVDPDGELIVTGEVLESSPVLPATG